MILETLQSVFKGISITTTLEDMHCQPPVKDEEISTQSS